MVTAMSERKRVVERYFDGSGRMKDGPVHRFAFCDVFSFRDDLICRVESYLVPLT
jgi:hypothetical protein